MCVDHGASYVGLAPGAFHFDVGTGLFVLADVFASAHHLAVRTGFAGDAFELLAVDVVVLECPGLTELQVAQKAL